MGHRSLNRRTPAARTRLAVATVLACTGLAALPVPASAVNIQLINESGQPAQDIYVMLTGQSITGSQLAPDTPVALSALSNSTFSLASISAGRLYISYGGPVTDNEGNYSPIRYDKIELTDPGVANLTAVDFFAIPFDMQALDSTGATLGSALTYRCHTSTILPQLRALAPSAEVDSGGQFMRFLSPQLSPSSYPSMAGYIASLAGQTIQVNDAFYGSPFQTVSYSGTFGPDGSITLTGTTTTPSTGQTSQTEPVTIAGSTLESGIYTGNTTYTVGDTTENTGFNDEYTVIYRDVVAGFALGYWGGKYGNNSASWLGQPDYAAARASLDPFAAYDPYGATIGSYSSAYDYAFNDVGPTAVTVPLNASTATLQITIDSDQGPDTPGCVGASTPAAPPAPASPSAVVTPTAPVTPAAPTKPVPPSPTGRPGQVNMVVYSNAVTLDQQSRALLTLGCGADPCRGLLTLNLGYTVRVKAPRRAGKARGRPTVRVVKRTLVISTTEFAIDEGTSRRVWVSITPAGVTRIKAARGHRLGVLAEASVGPRSEPTTVAQHRVILQSYTPPHRRPARRRR